MVGSKLSRNISTESAIKLIESTIEYGRGHRRDLVIKFVSNLLFNVIQKYADTRQQAKNEQHSIRQLISSIHYISCINMV